MKKQVDASSYTTSRDTTLDGTLQARKTKVPNPDVHAMGVAFIARQLKELGRTEKFDPERTADLALTAMSSEALEGIRIEAGRFSYGMEGLWSGAMRTGPAAV